MDPDLTHMVSLPFASVYAKAFENSEYSGRFTVRHGLRIYYKLQYGIVCAEWDDENARRIIDICTCFGNINTIFLRHPY